MNFHSLHQGTTTDPEFPGEKETQNGFPSSAQSAARGAAYPEQPPALLFSRRSGAQPGAIPTFTPRSQAGCVLGRPPSGGLCCSPPSSATSGPQARHTGTRSARARRAAWGTAGRGRAGAGRGAGPRRWPEALMGRGVPPGPEHAGGVAWEMERTGCRGAWAHGAGPRARGPVGCCSAAPRAGPPPPPRPGPAPIGAEWRRRRQQDRGCPDAQPGRRGGAAGWGRRAP